MNRTKYLDRYQLIIGIVGLSALAVAIVLYVVMLFTAHITFGENGEITAIEYILPLQLVQASFVLIHMTAAAWFIIRSITYRARIKEEESE